MSRFVIIDWTGRQPYPGRHFATLNDAWSFLTEDQRRRNGCTTQEELDATLGEFSVAEIKLPKKG